MAYVPEVLILRNQLKRKRNLNGMKKYVQLQKLEVVGMKPQNQKKLQEKEVVGMILEVHQFLLQVLGMLLQKYHLLL